MHSIIKKAQVELEGHDVNNFSAPGAVGVHPKRNRATSKSARLVQVDGAPCAVEVTCSCGEVHIVELDFEQN